MIREVIVLEEAARDIEAGIDFYEAAEPGFGLYFRDNIVGDLRRLAHHFGEHAVHFGFHPRFRLVSPTRFTTETTAQPAWSRQCSIFDGTRRGFVNS